MASWSGGQPPSTQQQLERAPGSMRGRLVKGVWQCDCDPRRAASYFETKNGGKNHGRWFFTCSKPRDKGCGFFLWEDVAKQREEAELPPVQRLPEEKISSINQLATSKDESTTKNPLPRTPTIRRFFEPIERGGLPTPETHSKRKRDGDVAGYLYQTPSKNSRLNPLTPPTKSRDVGSPPSNRDVIYPSLKSRLEVLDADMGPPLSTLPLSRGSAQSSRSTGLFTSATDELPCVPPTPTPSRLGPPPPLRNCASDGNLRKTQPCELTKRILDLLESHKIYVPPKAKKELTEMLGLNDLRTLGIVKGRDICRLAIKERETRVRLLQARVEALEAERESWKASTRHEPYV